ncbi:MAG: hypothetical protein ACXABO_04360 [Promethearchaeota archaeon]|jgi:hypothetical protein
MLNNLEIKKENQKSDMEKNFELLISGKSNTSFTIVDKSGKKIINHVLSLELG